MESLLFGDIFRFKEGEYVYLATGDGVDFAAKILDMKSTRQIVDLDNRRAMKYNSGKSDGNSLYCYVILQTDEYRDQATHFGKSQYGSGQLIFEKIGCSLCVEDKQAIKNKILDPNSSVPIGLREVILKMDI